MGMGEDEGRELDKGPRLHSSQDRDKTYPQQSLCSATAPTASPDRQSLVKVKRSFFCKNHSGPIETGHFFPLLSYIQ